MKHLLVCILLAAGLVRMFSENIVLDGLNFSDDGNGTVRVHNIAEPSAVLLFLNNNETKDFSIVAPPVKSVFYIIVDNSGSIILDDFLEIRERVAFMIKNVGARDLIKVYKVNDRQQVIYDLGHFRADALETVTGLLREGKKSRIFDSVQAVVNEVAGSDHAGYYPYVVLFSDADDIGSGADMDALHSDVPFFYFSYFSKADPAKKELLSRLAERTKGKTLFRPSEKEILDLFFTREKRFDITVNFKVNEEEVAKSDTYFLDIKEGERSVRIDLKKYFAVKKNAANGDVDLSKSETYNELTGTESENGQSGSEDSQKQGAETGTATVEKDPAQNGRESGNDAENNGVFSFIKQPGTKVSVPLFGGKTLTLRGDMIFWAAVFLILLLLLVIILVIVRRLAGERGQKESSGGGRAARRGGIDLSGGQSVSGQKAGSSSLKKKESTGSVVADKTAKSPLTQVVQQKEEQASDSAVPKVADEIVEPSAQEKENDRAKIENQEQKALADEALPQQNENENEESVADDKEENVSGEEQAENDINNEETAVSAVEQEAASLVMKAQFRVKQDFLSHKKVSKFQLIHNKSASFVDDEEHSGEQVVIESKLAVAAVFEDHLTASGDVSLLLDEVITMKGIKLAVIRSEYFTEKRFYQYALYPVGEESGDLRELFNVQDAVYSKKKMDLFGKATAIIEQLVERNPEDQSGFSSEWRKCRIENADQPGYFLADRLPCIDTVVELNINGVIREYYIYKSEFTEEKGIVAYVRPYQS